MRIALAIQSLEGGGGTESYVTTIGDQLQRAGHDVWVYGAGDGPLGDRARELGLRVATATTALPAELDVLLVQDLPSSLELLGSHPSVPQLYVWHSEFFDVQVPPQLEGAIAGIVTLYESAMRKIDALAVKVPVTKLSQPVDIERFRPRAPLPERPRKALALGNYLSGERLELLKRACDRAGLELRIAGALADGAIARSEDALNGADIVFAKAKVAIEAMACGRAVYVYDVFGTDGWVTSETYPALKDANFAGIDAGAKPTLDALVVDFARYDREMGLVNRDLAVANHSAIKHTGALVRALEAAVAARAGAPPAPPLDHAYELSRLARINWRHETRAFQLAQLLHITEFERDQLRAKLHEAERRLDSDPL